VVEGGLGLALGPGECGELVQQPGVLQCDLAGFGFEVERAAGVAGVDAGVGVVDRGGDAVPLEDAGAQQTAGARSDDGDSCVQGDLLVAQSYRTGVRSVDLKLAERAFGSQVGLARAERTGW
jgi:hypothetical protein